MIAYLSDGRFNSIALIVIALITVIPATLAAYWSHKAKNNSIEAKENSAGALHEVKANGGMSDPDPTLKDYVYHLGDLMGADGRRIDRLEANFDLHMKHSRVMDAALAEVFFAVKPDLKRDDLEEMLNN